MLAPASRCERPTLLGRATSAPSPPQRACCASPLKACPFLHAPDLLQLTCSLALDTPYGVRSGKGWSLGTRDRLRLIVTS